MKIFSGRIFIDDGKSAKYLNSPETPIFSKNAVLYGIDKAKDSIRKNNFSILVEGQMDLILSHQAGYRNTIATSGTALSDSTVSKENVVSNLGLVRRLSSNIVLSFDADKAGANATIRPGKVALSLDMDVSPKTICGAGEIAESGADRLVSRFAFDGEHGLPVLQHDKIHLALVGVAQIAQFHAQTLCVLQPMAIFKELGGNHIFKTRSARRRLGPVP